MASLTCAFELRLKDVLNYLCLCCLSFINFAYGQYRLAPKNTIGVEGKSAVMHCAINSKTGLVVWNHVVSGRPTLQLSMGGHIDLTLGLDKSQRITVIGNRGRGEYHLRIKNVKMSDAGRYECMALVGLTRIVKRSAALKVVRSPRPGYPMCQMEPAFGLAPGMEVVISCETMGGKPVGKVRWWNGKKALTPKTEGHVSYTHTLTRVDYGQTFTCQEITPAYRTPRTCEVIPLEVDLKADLQPSPRAEVRPGESVIFTCFGQGTTSFEYSWQLNEKPLPFSKNIVVFGSNGHKLRIDRVTAASNNAKVSCALTNSHGFATKSSSVISIMPSNRKPRPRPTAQAPITPFVPQVPGRPARPSTAYPAPRPTLGVMGPGDYDVQFESEFGQDWGMDHPSGGGEMSSPAMTAMAAALVGVLIGVVVAVGMILTRKYMRTRERSPRTLVDTTHSTSIPCSSLIGDLGSSEPSVPPAEYSLPPRDYPRHHHRRREHEEEQMSYLDLRPESMNSQRSTYQGLHTPRPRSSTYDPQSSYYSDEYDVDDYVYSPEYYEDVLNQEQGESLYHYRFSPPVDPSEIQVRCMSADRATRHFFPR